MKQTLALVTNKTIQAYKQNAQKIISSLTDSAQIACWNTYLSLLNEIIVTDPQQVYLPTFPKKNSEGVYVDRYIDGVWKTSLVEII